MREVVTACESHDRRRAVAVAAAAARVAAAVPAELLVSMSAKPAAGNRALVRTEHHVPSLHDTHALLLSAHCADDHCNVLFVMLLWKAGRLWGTQTGLLQEGDQTAHCDERLHSVTPFSACLRQYLSTYSGMIHIGPCICHRSVCLKQRSCLHVRRGVCGHAQRVCS